MRKMHEMGAGLPGPTPLKARTLDKGASTIWAQVLGLVLAMLVAVGLCPEAAYAKKAKQQPAQPLPSVLVVDSNTGDGAQCAYHWLGEAAEPLAEQDAMALYTCADAAWWAAGGGSDEAPATFVLYGSGARALTADDVIWALDEIRKSGAEPRTFVVAMGTAGLPVRQYAEDLASQKQSSRADLVGMVFCGTPHNGYSAIETYPESVLWEKLARSVSLTTQDLTPASSYLANLNAGTFPSVTKSLMLVGSVGDLGFGVMDGAGLTTELVPTDALSSQMELAQVDATIGQAINLTGAWQPFTSAIDYPQRDVDSKTTELLSAMSSYATADEVKAQVQDFYDSWFAEGAPVTHNSNVLLLDLSGSMKEDIDAKNTKLEAAKEAAQEYLLAMSAVSELPQSAPMDVAIIGFAEATTPIAVSFDQAARDSIEGMTAYGETDIGLALDKALATLENAPTCATPHILLLSDGESTQGQTEDQIFAGAIAKAKKRGIVVDTIGFGNVGESDAGFLKRVAKETGGSYYTAQDTYSLKVNFLTSYYSSLGLAMVDEELAAGTTTTEVIGDIDNRTSALEIGIVSEEGEPSVTLIRNGDPVDEALYTTSSANGLTSVQCLAPAAGSYELQLSGTSGAMHVFAVRQQGIVKAKAVAGEKLDLSVFLLAATGVALIVALVGMVLFTRRRSAGRRVAVAPAAGPMVPPATSFAGSGTTTPREDGGTVVTTPREDIEPFAAAPRGEGGTAVSAPYEASGTIVSPAHDDNRTVVSWESDDPITKNGSNR